MKHDRPVRFHRRSCQHLTGPVLVGLLLAGCTTANANIAPSTSPSAAQSTPDTSPPPAVPTGTPSATPVDASASAPLLFTGGPLNTDPSIVDPAPVGAFVLGDSISLSVAPLLSRLGYPVTGRVGQTVNSDFLRQHLASATAQSAPAWVIVLGTNNRGDETDIARLDEWLATIKGLRNGRPRQHVYWVTPHRPDEYNGSLRDYDLDAFNQALKSAAAERRWLHVLDFSALAEEHPEWFAQDGGRLHPDEAGQEALAALIAGPDAPLAEQVRAITTLTWPTPEPTEEPDEFVDEFGEPLPGGWPDVLGGDLEPPVTGDAPSEMAEESPSDGSISDSPDPGSSDGADTGTADQEFANS